MRSRARAADIPIAETVGRLLSFPRYVIMAYIWRVYEEQDLHYRS